MINTMLQTSMGDFYFDAVFKTEHNTNMIITEHPVQTGAPVSDHAYLEPEEVTCEIGMSDVNGDGGAVQMYQQLRELMNLREPFTVVTRLNTYENMLIASLSVPDDYTTMFGLKASIIFKQVRMTTVATIQVQDTVSSSKSEPSSSGGGKELTQAQKNKVEKKIQEAQKAKKAAPVKNTKVPKPVEDYSSTKLKVTKNIAPTAGKNIMRAWD